MGGVHLTIMYCLTTALVVLTRAPSVKLVDQRILDPDHRPDGEMKIHWRKRYFDSASTNVHRRRY
jgi:hypothetical protein